MNKEELRNLDIESINVKLKPILGIKPKYYLAGIYSVLILLILFFIFLFPGIKRNGTQMYINSSMPGSAVFADNMYLGSTPGTFFVNKGTQEIKISHQFFEDHIEKTNVKGRVFFSLFTPRKSSLAVDLKITDAQGLYDAGLKETASWGLIKVVQESYQPNPVISKTAAGLVHSGNLALAESFITETLAHISNEYMFADWLAADSIVKSNQHTAGNIFSSQAMFDFLAKAENYPNLYYFLYYIAGNARERNELRRTDTFKALSAEITAMNNPADAGSADRGKTLDINGLHFVYFKGGPFMSGAASDNLGVDYKGTDSHPVMANTGDFYMLDREVTRGMYKRFTAAKPGWQKKNASVLAARGLVSEYYMAGWEDKKDNEPADYISWYAADAFCKYLNDSLPAGLAAQGYKVRLPGEYHWELAALHSEQDNPVFQNNNYIGPLPVNGRTPDQNKIYDLKGNLWEWCSGWYATALRFYTDLEGNSPVLNKNGAERNVRGGSWANSSSEIMTAARASQPPEWCTPYLGFRVIITRD